MAASETSASEMIHQVKQCSVSWLAQCVRTWAKYFYEHKALSLNMQGLHRKVDSLIDDEDIQIKCRTWLLSLRPAERTGRAFAKYLNEELFPDEFGYEANINKCVRTARNWLDKLGFFRFNIRFINGNRFRPPVGSPKAYTRVLYTMFVVVG